MYRPAYVSGSNCRDSTSRAVVEADGTPQSAGWQSIGRRSARFSAASRNRGCVIPPAGPAARRREALRSMRCPLTVRAAIPPSDRRERSGR